MKILETKLNLIKKLCFFKKLILSLFKKPRWVLTLEAGATHLRELFNSCPKKKRTVHKY